MLNQEAGGHRIQRVPPTERKGRVHSSTVTVAITDPAVKQFVLNDSDLRIEWYSGTGAGGQHRNKHQNSCRITHVPSGTICTAQCRSRETSLSEARSALEVRVREAYMSQHAQASAISRKAQVGSGERGDKIRTYRFQDNTVKDHQTERSTRLDRVMAGQFELLHV